MASHWNAGTNYGLYYRDSGTWKFAANGPISTATQGFDVYCLQKIKSVWHAGTSNGLYSLGTAGWTQTGSAIGNTPVRCLTLVGNSENAGTKTGIFFRQGGLWNFAVNGPGAPPVYCIGLDPAGNPYAGTSGGVYTLLPGGWTSAGKGLGPSLAVRSLGIVAGSFFAGTSGGLYGYISKKDGWKAVADILSSTTVRCIKQFPTGDAYLGTDYGVYQLKSGKWVNLDATTTGLTLPYTAYCLDNIDGNLTVGTEQGLYFLSNNKWKRHKGIPNSVSVLCLNLVSD